MRTPCDAMPLSRQLRTPERDSETARQRDGRVSQLAVPVGHGKSARVFGARPRLNRHHHTADATTTTTTTTLFPPGKPDPRQESKVWNEVILLYRLFLKKLGGNGVNRRF